MPLIPEGSRLSPMEPLLAGLWDSHSHPTLMDGWEEARGRAFASGLRGIVAVGIDLASSRAAILMAAEDPRVRATVGIHPHQASSLTPQTARELERLAERASGVGETGLDLYRLASPLEDQVRSFRIHLDLGWNLGLPVVIHVREAWRETFLALEEFREDRGGLPVLVFHCFSGGPEEAARSIGLGGFISFAGNLTYRRSEELRQVARRVPSERLLVETDSPYLPPEPHRGKQNEPAFLRLVAEALATARGEDPASVAALTGENASRLFRPRP